jgi:hypothetical protein
MIGELIGDAERRFEARHIRLAPEIRADHGIDLQDYRGTDVVPDHPTG